jgi:hypothetical protein
VGPDLRRPDSGGRDARRLLHRFVIFNIDGESHQMRSHRARTEKLRKGFVTCNEYIEGTSPVTQPGHFVDRPWGVSEIGENAAKARSVPACRCILKRSTQQPRRTLEMVSSSRGSVEVSCSVSERWRRAFAPRTSAGIRRSRPLGVLVAPALPGALEVTEVDRVPSCSHERTRAPIHPFALLVPGLHGRPLSSRGAQLGVMMWWHGR